MDYYYYNKIFLLCINSTNQTPVIVNYIHKYCIFELLSVSTKCVTSSCYGLWSQIIAIGILLTGWIQPQVMRLRRSSKLLSQNSQAYYNSRRFYPYSSTSFPNEMFVILNFNESLEQSDTVSQSK